MPTWDDLRELGVALPGLVEETSYDPPTLKVNGKLLVRLEEDLETIALRTEFEERQALVHGRPDVFFVTPHYEHHPMVLVRAAGVDREELGELLTEAWLDRVPKRVVAGWEASLS
jgi:hypothetical protein